MKKEINDYVKTLMDLFTNAIFTKKSIITNSEYEILKTCYNSLTNIIKENNIENPSVLEFTSMIGDIFASYHITEVDPILGTFFDTDFMLLYNSFAKLRNLANKIYNNIYNTRKI